MFFPWHAVLDPELLYPDVLMDHCPGVLSWFFARICAFCAILCSVYSCDFFFFFIQDALWNGIQLSGSGLKRGMKNHIFLSGIGSGFWEPCGTPPPKMLRSNPPSVLSQRAAQYVFKLVRYLFCHLSSTEQNKTKQRTSQNRENLKTPYSSVQSESNTLLNQCRLLPFSFSNLN